MDESTPEQMEKLRQAIVSLETQQNDFGLDLTVQIADLRQRLRELTSIAQRGSGAVATGGVAGGKNSVVVAGSVYGNIYHLYQSSSGVAKLSPDDFERILEDYLRWVYQTYSHTRLYGIESVQGPPVRDLSHVFIPVSLRRFEPLHRQEVDRLAQIEQSETAQIYRHLSNASQRQGDHVALGTLLTLHHKLAIVGGAGSLPQGASPYGCLDMCGNVWEWTRSLWGESADITLSHPAPILSHGGLLRIAIPQHDRQFSG